MTNTIKQSVSENIAPGITRKWEIQNIIFHDKSDYQEILIANTNQGVSLFCNDERQSTEFSQQMYHEGQIFPAALMSDQIESVLIIGSSEGVISKMSVLLGATHVTHVDIDEVCLNACAKHLPYGYTEKELVQYKALKGRINVIIGDGFDFVENCILNNTKFDLIIMDLPDEQNEKNAQENRLYEKDFLIKLSSLLMEGGAFISQAGCSTYWRNTPLIRAWKRFNEVFKCCVYFEMEEHDWVWLVGTNFACEDPTKRMLRRYKDLQIKPDFIDEQSIQKSTIPAISLRNI